MSEECKDPTVVIPRAMIGTILVNGLLGFGMILALLFSLGDVTELFKSPVSLAGYPFIQIYYNATQSLSGTNAMTCVSLVIVISTATFQSGKSSFADSSQWRISVSWQAVLERRGPLLAMVAYLLQSSCLTLVKSPKCPSEL